MDSAKRNELKNAYKDKLLIGGIYSIQCDGNHRMLIKSTQNLEGQKNRFAFAIATNSCPEPAMRKEWNEYGAQSFSFVIIEEIRKKETQTEREFSEDIDVLFKMWQEKHKQDALL